MSGSVAVNKETGEVLVLSPDGKWTAPQVAENPQTKERLFYDGKAWQPMPSAEPARGVVDSAARGIGLGARAVAQGIAALPGVVYDAAAAPFNALAWGAEKLGAPTLPRIRSARENIGSLADAVGLPKAETEGERMTSGVVEALAGVGTGVGAGKVMANAAQPTVAAVGRALSTQPVTQAASAATGAAVGEATDSPVAGLAASLATPLAIAGAKRVISPVRNVNNPGRQALVAAAEGEGIPVTAGQATGSRFLQTVESQLEQLPLTAGPQREIREGQNRAFIEAAFRRTGVTADDTLPSTINSARERIGGTIGEIANRNTLRVTPQLDDALARMEADLRFLPAESATPVRERIKQFRGMMTGGAQAPSSGLPQGVMMPGTGIMGSVPPPVTRNVSGKSYRMLDSEIGRSIRSTSDGDVRTSLGNLREVLRSAMDDSISPADADAWREARRQYANLMVIANAAGRAGSGAAEGMMSPLALRQALDASTGQGYVYGKGDLNELARIGQALIRPPPDSGTAGRSYANSLLTGSLLTGAGGTVGAVAGGPLGAAAGAAGSLLLPRLAQMLMNTQTGQRYLRNQAAGSPTITPDLLRALTTHQPAAAQRVGE